MHDDRKIHLVPSRITQHGITSIAPRVIEAKEIVRETLRIVEECNQALTGIDQQLVDLVTSLVVVRLRKAGER